MAVVAMIPRESDSTLGTVKAGFAAKLRAPKTTSFCTCSAQFSGFIAFPAKTKRPADLSSARKQGREPRHELICPLAGLGSSLKLQHGLGHLLRGPTGPATVRQEKRQHGGRASPFVAVQEDMSLDDVDGIGGRDRLGDLLVGS